MLSYRRRAAGTRIEEQNGTKKATGTIDGDRHRECHRSDDGSRVPREFCSMRIVAFIIGNQSYTPHEVFDTLI